MFESPKHAYCKSESEGTNSPKSESLPAAKHAKSREFQEQCELLQERILARPTTFESLFEYTGVTLLKERDDYSQKLTELIDQLENVADRADVYRCFSEVSYKRDKLLIDFRSAMLRASELRLEKKTAVRKGRQTKSQRSGRLPQKAR